MLCNSWFDNTEMILTYVSRLSWVKNMYWESTVKNNNSKNQQLLQFEFIETGFPIRLSLK